MCNIVTFPILRHILGYTNDQQLHQYFHLMTLRIQVHKLMPWHEYVQHCYEVYGPGIRGTQVKSSMRMKKT